MEQNDMELIYDKFSNTIYRTAFSYCKNHADAEDITSDVFIKCFTGKYAYDSDEHLKAWLIRCTINRCKDIFKSFRFKHVVALDDAEIVYESPEECTVFEDITTGIGGAKKGGFSTCAIFDETNADETDALKQLSDHYITGWEELL